MALPRPRFALLHSDLRSGVFVGFGLAIHVAVVYAVVVLAGGRLVGQTQSPNLLLSIVATATVAISFESVQSRLERGAARVFRLRASPYEVLRRFAGTAVGAVDEDLPLRMARLLAEGTGTAAAQVWLMGGGRPVLAASWPAPTDDRSPPDSRTLISAADGWRSLPVRDGGETLGVLSVREHKHRPLTPVEQRLFAGLAAQAGLVLRSARLRTELSARLVELSARASDLQSSRERLIETQDDERKRLERDIHDGAQQNLVALTVNLRLAQTLLGRSRERAAAVMAAQAVAAQQAIDTLTQLSRGIYPTALAEDGLIAALGAAAAASPLPVQLSADATIRLPSEVEAALYFCGLEALQNAAKHSGGTCAKVLFGRTGDSVYLSVSDDGGGFATAGVATGSGTSNMRDRIDAVGGVFSITSATGRGTCVEARVALPVGVV
jgi:signal transduction histidine kinase